MFSFLITTWTTSMWAFPGSKFVLCFRPQTLLLTIVLLHSNSSNNCSNKVSSVPESNSVRMITIQWHNNSTSNSHHHNLSHVSFGANFPAMLENNWLVILAVYWRVMLQFVEPQEARVALSYRLEQLLCPFVLYKLPACIITGGYMLKYESHY